MRSPLLAVAACFATLALIVAGCGSSDTKASNDYVNAVNKVQTDFANSVQQVGTASGGSNPAAAAKKTFADLQAAINKAINNFKAVHPPDKVKALHNQLIAEMQQFEQDVKAAGDSLGSGSAQKILAAQSTLASSASTLGTRISQTINQINQKLHG